MYFSKLELIHFFYFHGGHSNLTTFSYRCSMKYSIWLINYYKRKSSGDGYFISDKYFIALYWTLHNSFPKKILIRST